MKLKVALLLPAFVSLFGCHDSPAPATANHPSRPASATEIFNLRSKCAQLGEKIMEANIIGTALTQSQVSHYDPQTNRCYVDLNVNMADLAKFDDYYSRTVLDGQTGEMLAHIENKKGQKTAYIKDSSEAFSYDAAIAKMEALMADDRKQ